MEFAIKLAIVVPVAALGAWLMGLWRQRHPWQPGRMERWLYARAERKVTAMPGLTPAVRAERLARLQAELHTPPVTQREFGEQFRRDFLYAVGVFAAAELIRLFFHLLKF